MASNEKNLSGLTVLALTTLAVTNLLGAKRKQTVPSMAGMGQPARKVEFKAPVPDADQGTAPTAGGLAAAPVDHRPGIIGIARSIIDRFTRDNATLTAAGIAFYLLLSIFPGLAALVSIYALFGDPAEVGRQIAPFSSLLPPEAMKLLNDGLQGFIKSAANSHISFTLFFSLAVAIWSARAAMSSIMVGLNVAYEETERRSFIVTTLVSLALTVGAVVFAVAAIFAIAVVPALLAFVHLDKVVEDLLVYGRWPLLALLVIVGFGLLYRVAPDRSHPRWRWITWGSGIAAVLWLVGSIVFSFYVSHFGSYDATYGSLGAVIILLLWFWVSALVMILGAEIDSELDTRATNGGGVFAGTPPSAGPPPAKKS